MADPLGGVHILFLRQTTPTSGFGAPGGRIRSGVTRVKGVCEQHGPGLPWGLAPEIPAPGGARAYPGRPAPLPPIPRGAIAGHTVLFPPADPFTNPPRGVSMQARRQAVIRLLKTSSGMSPGGRRPEAPNRVALQPGVAGLPRGVAEGLAGQSRCFRALQRRSR